MAGRAARLAAPRHLPPCSALRLHLAGFFWGDCSLSDTPLPLVLGHERCGAVTATVEAIRTGAEPPGHIGAVVDALRPSVEPVMDQLGDPVENGVRASVRATAATIPPRS